MILILTSTVLQLALHEYYAWVCMCFIWGREVVSVDISGYLDTWYLLQRQRRRRRQRRRQTETEAETETETETEIETEAEAEPKKIQINKSIKSSRWVGRVQVPK